MMDWQGFFANLPTVGWVAIFGFMAILIFFGLLIYNVFKNSNIKVKNFELSKTTKELYQTEGKNLLDNQSTTAHNLIKKIWIDLFETGKKIFNITDKNELFILEDISHLIENKLNYEVKNDLTRNHITEKNDNELQQYSDAKAIGYYRAVLAMLYDYNIQLPYYYLPEIMSNITIEDFKKMFYDIYFSARKIAGGKNE